MGLQKAGGVAVYRSPFIRREVRANLLYHDKYNLATATLAPAIQVFRANSMFDPDFTGTGHQPMYRDQIVAQYQTYKVLSAKFHYEFSTSNTNNGIVSVMAYNSTPPTDLNEIAEFSRRMPEILISQRKCTGAVKIANAVVLGLVESEFVENSVYNTAVSTNPSWTSFVQFALHAATNTDTGCTLHVMIEFDVLFQLPVDPGLS